VVYCQSYEFNTVLEVEDMGFMFGESFIEPNLKLHCSCGLKLNAEQRQV
jgi:hypothetical protein